MLDIIAIDLSMLRWARYLFEFTATRHPLFEVSARDGNADIHIRKIPCLDVLT